MLRLSGGLIMNVVISRLKRMVVPPGWPSSRRKEVVLIEDKDDLHHQIEVYIGDTIAEDPASEHRGGIIYIVDVDVAPQ